MKTNTLSSFASLFFLTFFCLLHLHATDMIVNPGDNLQGIINNAQGGDIITINGGNYGGTIHLQNKACTEANPLIIKSGNGIAHITGTGDYNSGTTFRITNSSYVVLDGIKVSSSLYGIFITQSDHIIITNCTVEDTGQEGIHANDNVDFLDILKSTIHDTGRRPDHEGWGEGIYIGGASSNALNSHIYIEGNEIYECGFGEGINIKASDSEKVTIKNNHVHDIHPGKTTTPNSQWNGGAIAVSHHFSTMDRLIWIEDNLIENISGGQVSNTGIMTQQSGVRVIHNTIRNCLDRGIWFNDHESRNACWNFGNSYINNGTDVFVATQAQVFTSDPGRSPYAPQDWYVGITQEPHPEPNGENIALNKPVVVTAQQAGQDGTKAVDGSIEDLDRWSAEFYPQSIEINLQGTYELERVDVYPLANRSYQYFIESKIAGGSYTELVNRQNNTTGGTVIIDDLTGEFADHVKFTFTGASNYDGTWISINEIEIFGTPAGGETKDHILESEGSVYVNKPESGIILTSPDGSCYKMTVGNDGQFTSVQVNCPN